MVSAHPTTLLLGLTVATSLFLFSTALPAAIPPHRYPYVSSSASSVVPSSSSSSSSRSRSSQQHTYGHFYAQDPSTRQTKDQANILVEDLQSPHPPQQPYSQDNKASSSSGSRSESAGEPLGRDTHAFQDLLFTRPSPFPQQQQQQQQQQHSSSPSTSFSTLPQPPRHPFAPNRANKQAPLQQQQQQQQQHQQHQHQVDLRVNNFKSHALTTTTAQDQILHQCTTHFLALLDTEISDRLLAQLSRLVMMLPVIGVETRAVIRTQVAEVMQQVVAGLKNYEVLGRVIRTAVDDAGVVLATVAPPEASLGESSKSRSRQDGLLAMGDTRYDQSSEYDDVDDEIPTATVATAQATAPTTPTIDESQIPVLTDIAMEAVLDYMAEILTPSLVIHQLTEAIQGALFDISKQRRAIHRLRVQQLGGRTENENGYLEDVNGVDTELENFSSQLLGGGRRGSGGSPADRHGVDLLSDEWILAGPSSSLRFNGKDSSVLEEEDEDEDDDPRGQDEDLWDKDMEIHERDSTGRLFEDFEDLEDNTSSSNNNDGTDSANQLVMSTATEQDMEDWDMAARTAGDEADGVEGEDDETSDPFSIGIRDSDETGSSRRSEGIDNDADGGEDEDADEYDPMVDTREDYGRERYLQQSYFNRFQKRSLFDTESQKPAVAASVVKLPTADTTRPSTPPTPSPSATTTRTIRRPNLTPDLRLENLLTQLIEPLLTTFIEEDFPASCKRVQGELMDGIIWSLDQGEFNGAGGSSDGLDSDEERMLLLSELEY